ncbi:MAG: DUF512 domain-containing protein [Microthrixaceae bacterium]|nr:DUF512 domain-containing protein [Microthrixaceae bacterium]
MSATAPVSVAPAGTVGPQRESHARVLAVAPESPAYAAGIREGDLIMGINGRPVRDIIEYRVLTDEEELTIDVTRGGLEQTFEVAKQHGQPLGIDIDSPVFDEVRTCDNHCEFCFIYQLPPGMRKSLHLKDDDYRLSFLYGNFTTLTRFTEADLERVVTESLSPLYVSIHATDPTLRVEMLRNRRGAMSLRWLRALLDHGIEIHGQIVVCPGLNDGAALEQTLCGILDEYPELADVAVVPLGVSDFSTEKRMRTHTVDEARFVVDAVDEWQEIFLATLGRRMVYASDEYYLMANKDFPDAHTYGDFSMHEDGIGMARAFQAEFNGESDEGIGIQSGFFASVDGAPAVGYRAPRTEPESESAGTPVSLSPRRNAPVGVLTGSYGARILAPLVDTADRNDVRIVEVENRFFGGNVAVAGLMVGEDLIRVLSDEPQGHRYLLPDVCLSQGRFLDGLRPEDLPRPVEIIKTDGVALRRALTNNTRLTPATKVAQ